MPTVTDLLDSICDDLGLDPTTNSDDRTAALRALNRANREVCQRTLRSHKSVDYTPAQALVDVDLSAVPTLKDEFVGLDHVRVVGVGGAVSQPIRHVQRDFILNNRLTTQGQPGSYAYAWPNVMLDRPADGAYSLRLAYVGLPATLVESSPSSGEESTPTTITPGWHDRLLAGLAKVILLEGREGRESDASYHRGLVVEAIQDFKAAQVREGGLSIPGDTRALRAFDTPSNLRVR